MSLLLGKYLASLCFYLLQSTANPTEPHALPTLPLRSIEALHGHLRATRSGHLPPCQWGRYKQFHAVHVSRPSWAASVNHLPADSPSRLFRAVTGHPGNVWKSMEHTMIGMVNNKTRQLNVCMHKVVAEKPAYLCQLNSRIRLPWLQS